MSESHARRLDAVRREKDAAEEPLTRSVGDARLDPARFRTDLEDLERARTNVERTYYVRIVAEMEGMLFRHLRDHWPRFVFDENDGAARLANHVRNRLDPATQRTVPAALTDEVLAAVRYRNFLAHGMKGEEPPRVPYVVAYGRIRDLVLFLPPMLGAHDPRA